MGRPDTSAQRRRQIVEAFIDELAAHGYEQTSMARLGAAAGLRASLMHYYFPTKHDILLASIPVLEAAFAERRARYTDACATPRQRLDALIDAHLALDARASPRHVAAWIQALALAQLDPEMRRVMAALLSARHAELATVLAEHRVADAAMLASGILATILGMFQLAALTPELVRKGGAAALVKRQTASLLEET